MQYPKYSSVYDCYRETVISGMLAPTRSTGEELVNQFCVKTGNRRLAQVIVEGDDSLLQGRVPVAHRSWVPNVSGLVGKFNRLRGHLGVPGLTENLPGEGICIGHTLVTRLLGANWQFLELTDSVENSLIVQSTLIGESCALLEALMVQYVQKNSSVYYIAGPFSRRIFPLITDIQCNLLAWCANDEALWSLLLRSVTGLDLDQIAYFFQGVDLPLSLGELAVYVLKELPIAYHEQVLEAIQSTELNFGNLFEKTAKNEVLTKLANSELSLQFVSEACFPPLHRACLGLNTFNLVSLLIELFPQKTKPLIAFELEESSSVSNSFMQNVYLQLTSNWIVKTNDFDVFAIRPDLRYCAQRVYAFKQTDAMDSLSLLEKDEFVMLNGFNSAGPYFPRSKSKIIKEPRFLG